MADITKKIEEIEFHGNAQDSIQQNAKQFADSLILQSKIVAVNANADEVQASHVDEAKQIVLSLTQRKNLWRDTFIALGGIGLGIAIQGIIAEYSVIPPAQPRVGYFAFYFVMGIVSAVLFTFGILKR